MKTYKTKALGSMVQALLSYPDSCVQFPESIIIRDKRADEVLETIDAPILRLQSGELLPKDRDFVGIVKKERDEGRKVLCYLTFTNSRDIRPRLKNILEEEKIRVGVLESSISPKRREEAHPFSKEEGNRGYIGHGLSRRRSRIASEHLRDRREHEQGTQSGRRGGKDFESHVLLEVECGKGGQAAFRTGYAHPAAA